MGNRQNGWGREAPPPGNHTYPNGKPHPGFNPGEKYGPPLRGGGRNTHYNRNYDGYYGGEIELPFPIPRKLQRKLERFAGPFAGVLNEFREEFSYDPPPGYYNQPSFRKGTDGSMRSRREIAEDYEPTPLEKFAEKYEKPLDELFSKGGRKLTRTLERQGEDLLAILDMRDQTEARLLLKDFLNSREGAHLKKTLDKCSPETQKFFRDHNKKVIELVLESGSEDSARAPRDREPAPRNLPDALANDPFIRKHGKALAELGKACGEQMQPVMEFFGDPQISRQLGRAIARDAKEGGTRHLDAFGKEHQKALSGLGRECQLALRKFMSNDEVRADFGKFLRNGGIEKLAEGMTGEMPGEPRETPDYREERYVERGGSRRSAPPPMTPDMSERQVFGDSGGVSNERFRRGSGQPQRHSRDDDGGYDEPYAGPPRYSHNYGQPYRPRFRPRESSGGGGLWNGFTTYVSNFWNGLKDLYYEKKAQWFPPEDSRTRYAERRDPYHRKSSYTEPSTAADSKENAKAQENDFANLVAKDFKTNVRYSGEERDARAPLPMTVSQEPKERTV